MRRCATRLVQAGSKVIAARGETSADAWSTTAPVPGLGGGPLWPAGRHSFATAEPAVAEPADELALDQGVVEEVPDSRRLRGALARFVPNQTLSPGSAGSAENDKPQPLRFGDLPAVTDFMESLQSDKAPTGPLYDLPSWITANYPGMEVRPKSPFYDWAAWVTENLPPDQASLYLALDEHMSNEERRSDIMRKAQLELAQLWDWQHRRVAAGLPPNLTPQEEEEARRVALQRAQAAASRFAQQASEARSRADAAQARAVSLAGTPQELVEVALAAVHRAEADYAEALREDALNPTTTPAMLQTCAITLRSARMQAERARQATDSGDTSAAAIAASNAVAAANSSSRIAAAAAPSATNLSIHSSHSSHTSSPTTSTSGTATTSSTGSTTTASSTASSSTPSSTAGSSTPSASRGAGGVLGFIRLAEKRPELEAAERVRRLEALRLSPEQKALVQQLGSQGIEALQDLASSFDRRVGRGLEAQAQQSARASRRVRTTLEAEAAHRRSQGEGDLLGASSSSSRMQGGEEALMPLYTSEVAQRAAQQAEARARTDFYTSERTAGVLDGSLLASQAAVAAARKATKSTQDASSPSTINSSSPASSAATDDGRASGTGSTSSVSSTGSTSGTGSTSSVSSTGSTSSSTGSTKDVVWSDLPLLNHEEELRVLGVRKRALARIVRQQTPSDNSLLRLDGPTFRTSDPLTWTTQRLRLAAPPPTPVWDLVKDYLQVKYADVLLRRQAATSVLSFIAASPPPAALAPPKSASGASQAMPSSGLTGVTGGRWAARLSAAEVAAVNERAGQLWNAGDMGGYASLMRTLASEGLLSGPELEQHLGAARLRQAELATASSGSNVSSGAEGGGSAEGVPSQAPPHPVLEELTAVLSGRTAPGLFGTASSSHAVQGSSSSAAQRGSAESNDALARDLWTKAAESFSSTGSSKATLSSTSGSANSVSGRGWAAWASSLASHARQLATARVGGTSSTTSGGTSTGTAASGTQGGTSDGGMLQGLGPGDTAKQRQQVEAAVQTLRGGPPSFAEAQALWHAYVRAAGSPPGSPSLSEVLLGDHNLRKARAAAQGDPAGLAAAEAQAAALNARLKHLYTEYVTRTGSPTVPPSTDNTTTNSASATTTSSTAIAAISSLPAHQSRPQGAQGKSMAQQAWERAVAANAGTDVRNPQQLLGMFKGGVTLQSLVRDHWESISRSHFRSSLKWADAPAWDTLWSLTRALYSKQLQPGNALNSPQQQAGQAGSGPSSTSSAAPAGQPVTAPAATQGSTTAAPAKPGILSFLRAGAAIPSSTTTSGSSTTPGTGAKSQAGMEQPAGPTTQHEGVVAAAGDGRSEAKKSEGEIKRQENERRAAAYRQQWEQYLEDQAVCAVREGRRGPSDVVWGSAHDLAPPYPGARPILRFTQALVLGPDSVDSSTQGLAERLRTISDSQHPAAQGMAPPPALRAPHPDSVRVVLRVKVSELAQEVGLSREAARHMVRVAGPRRYDPSSGDLVLSSTRRYCLERLHLLLRHVKEMYPPESHPHSSVAGSPGAAAELFPPEPQTILHHLPLSSDHQQATGKKAAAAAGGR